VDRNPYTPPAAPVADIASDSVTANRDVLLACKLFWVSFGLSLVSSASDALSQSTIPQMIGALIGLMIAGAVGFALTWWMVSKLKAGRNWMRLLVTIGAVLAYLSIPIFWKFYSSKVFPMYATNPLKAGIDLLATIPNIWSIVLLNLPRSRAWFSAMKRQGAGDRPKGSATLP
jgi:hypothetical protein